MNRTEWHACTDPDWMLRWLAEGASQRRLRLFSSACCREILQLTGQHAASLTMYLEALDEYADGVGPPPIPQVPGLPGGVGLLGQVLSSQLFNLALDHPGTLASMTSRGLLAIAVGQKLKGPATQRLLDLLHDLFDDLFLPAPLRLAWLDEHPHIESMAQLIYRDRQFTDLPILGDALEEAGCTDEELLEHLRSHPVHVRGCWALDAVLGRS